MVNTNEHISINNHTYKYIKDSMRQLYPYYKKSEENIVIIIHIYEARTTFLLFYDDFMMTKTPNQINWKHK